MHVIIPYSKNFGSKKLWRILQTTAIHQVFLPICTISIAFPMQMDFNLPKFFPPNFLQSLFAKVFDHQSCLLYGTTYASFCSYCVGLIESPSSM